MKNENNFFISFSHQQTAEKVLSFFSENVYGSRMELFKLAPVDFNRSEHLTTMQISEDSNWAGWGWKF